MDPYEKKLSVPLRIGENFKFLPLVSDLNYATLLGMEDLSLFSLILGVMGGLFLKYVG